MIDLYDEVAKIGWASICSEINCKDTACSHRRVFLQKEIVALCDRVREEEQERCRDIVQRHGMAPTFGVQGSNEASLILRDIFNPAPEEKKEI